MEETAIPVCSDAAPGVSVLALTLAESPIILSDY